MSTKTEKRTMLAADLDRYVKVLERMAKHHDDQEAHFKVGAKDGTAEDLLNHEVTAYYHRGRSKALDEVVSDLKGLRAGDNPMRVLREEG